MSGGRNRSARRDRTRVQMFIRQGGLCFWCGCPMSLMTKHRKGHAAIYATLDHIIKKEDGGTFYHTNVVAAHGVCNAARHHPISFNDHKTRLQKRFDFLATELEFGARTPVAGGQQP